MARASLPDFAREIRSKPRVTRTARSSPEARNLAELERLANETRSLIRKFHELSRVTAAEPATAPVPREPKTGCFAAIAHHVEELSRQLEKPARFVSRATEAEIPEKYHGFLQEVLVQFAKNSLVHGLELPEHRRRVGKPALGTL